MGNILFTFSICRLQSLLEKILKNLTNLIYSFANMSNLNFIKVIKCNKLLFNQSLLCNPINQLFRNMLELKSRDCGVQVFNELCNQ